MTILRKANCEGGGVKSGEFQILLARFHLNFDAVVQSQTMASDEL